MWVGFWVKINNPWLLSLALFSLHVAPFFLSPFPGYTLIPNSLQWLLQEENGTENVFGPCQLRNDWGLRLFLLWHQTSACCLCEEPSCIWDQGLERTMKTAWSSNLFSGHCGDVCLLVKLEPLPRILRPETSLAPVGNFNKQISCPQTSFINDFSHCKTVCTMQHFFPAPV